MKKFKLLLKKHPTLNNKLCALMLFAFGYISIWIEHDVIAFVFLSIVGVPLFFTRENVLD